MTPIFGGQHRVQLDIGAHVLPHFCQGHHRPVTVPPPSPSPVTNSNSVCLVLRSVCGRPERRTEHCWLQRLSPSSTTELEGYQTGRSMESGRP